MSDVLELPVTTTETLLTMPENGVDRYLIRGQLREKPVTRRNRWHSSVEARLAYLLWQWLDQQPPPRGNICSGEAGCILRHDPDTTVGIDIVYVSADLASRDAKGTTLIDGVPILAVEILSPSDTLEEIDEKVNEYLSSGVAQVWLVHPRFKTVEIFRPNAAPELFNEGQELDGGKDLPGFRVPVASIFTR
jgi:Uma2 family endonuclease